MVMFLQPIQDVEPRIEEVTVLTVTRDRNAVDILVGYIVYWRRKVEKGIKKRNAR
jgi:hypothetical protein